MNFRLIAVLFLVAGLNAVHAQDDGSATAAEASGAPAETAAAPDDGARMTLEDDEGRKLQVIIDSKDGVEVQQPVAEETKERIKQKVAELVERALDAKLEGSEEAENEFEQAAHELEKEIEQLEADGADINIDVSDLVGLTDENSGNFDFSDAAGMAMLVPIFGIIFVFGTPVLIVAFLLYFAHRKRRMNHDIISQYLASGKEIPPELMSGLFKETAAAPKNNLHRGMIMTGIGAGIFLWLLLVAGLGPASIGLIPLFIGIAQLLIWKLEGGGSGAKGKAGDQ